MDITNDAQLSSELRSIAQIVISSVSDKILDLLQKRFLKKHMVLMGQTSIILEEQDNHRKNSYMLGSGIQL